MVSTIVPKFVHIHGHGFSKRFNPTGMYYFNDQYRPAPCLIISPRPGRMAEWAWLQPLACMNLTQGSSVKRKSKFSAYFNTLDRDHLLNTTVLVHSSSIVLTHTQMESSN